MAGYSGTPLAKKLGLKDGLRVWRQGMPAAVDAEIRRAGLQLVHRIEPEPPLDVAHVFLTRQAELEAAVALVRPRLAPGGFLWISWPKKSAKVASEVTESDVRRIGLSSGLVDVKVCAIDETWSGLKFVIRKALR